MTEDDALRFLEQHQPLPADSDLKQSVIEEFDRVRRFFAENPAPSCVRFLLHVFGDGDGFGVYQLVEDTLLQQDRGQVIRDLRNALQSERRSVRYWCAQIAASFSDEDLVAPLAALLDEEDFDLKYAALTALEQAATPAAKAVILAFSKREREDELREMAEGIVAAL